MSENTRGRKILYIQHREMLALFTRRAKEDGFVIAPRFQGLPEGAQVVSVFDAPERAAFGFIIEHESFPQAEPGMEYERIPSAWEWTLLKTTEPKP